MVAAYPLIFHVRWVILSKNLDQLVQGLLGFLISSKLYDCICLVSSRGKISLVGELELLVTVPCLVGLYSAFTDPPLHVDL